MQTITFQITNSDKTDFLLELLSHLDFIQNIEIKETDQDTFKADEIIDDTLTEKQKELLCNRLEQLRNDTSDESEQESKIVIQRIREKLNRKKNAVQTNH